MASSSGRSRAARRWLPPGSPAASGEIRSRQRRTAWPNSVAAMLPSVPGERRGCLVLAVAGNGTFTGPAGTFRQRTEITKAQRDILRALKTDIPPRIYQLTPAAEP